MSDARSEKAHAFSSRGRVTGEMSGDLVGGHDLRRRTRSVYGTGSSVSYRLKVQPKVPVTLEFEEIENRDVGQAGVRGYSVWVDGRRAYFRTAQNHGAGPLHYFVQVPPRANTILKLTLQNESEAPFRLARLWAFGAFSNYFGRNDMAVPYYLAPTLQLGYADFEGERRKLQAVKDSLGAHPHARSAWTTWIAYANLSDRDLKQRLNYVVRLAQALDLPVQICFDTWWANTPGGSDGAGGFWTDVQYQQVVYNQTTQQYQLSIPNRWGNTPWLSVGQARLNAFKAARLQVAMRMLQQESAALRARGQAHLILAVNLDNEPVYWATGNAGLGSEILQADFNPVMVVAARRDKVLLDPGDGLNFAERLWLRNRLLAYNEQIARAASAGRDAIVVDAAGVHGAGDGLRHNIYTQAMVANAALQFPMQSDAYPFWETAAPSSARVGGEWNGDSQRERAAVLHQLPLGRTAQVNAESGNDESQMLGVRPGYALGQRYYALYNYPLDKMNVAAQDISDTSQRWEPIVYERVLREETFTDNSWPARVVEAHGLQRGVIGNTTAVALYPSAEARQGWLTYRLDSPQNVFAGLTLELSGRAFVSRDKNPAVFIRVLAGTQNSLASMSEVGRIFDKGDINAVHRFDLSSVARGQKSVFVRLELDAAQLPSSVLSWCSIYHLRWTQPWPQTLFQGAFTQDESLETQRQQNLLVSWRRDAELAMESLARAIDKAPQKAPQDELPQRAAKSELRLARGAYARGDYARAYRTANAAENWLALGAVYRVLQSGRLAPYPISIKTAAPLNFTINGWNHEEIAFDITADGELSAEFHIAGLSPGKTYVLLAQNGSDSAASWRLRRARRHDGENIKHLKTNAQGMLQWTMLIQHPAEPETGEILRGTYRGILQKTPPVLAVWREDGKGTERVTLNERTVITRGGPGQEVPAGSEQLQRGDAVVVRFNERGIDGGSAAQVTATTQLVEGVLQEVGQLKPYTMPFVLLRDAARPNIIDLSATLSLPNSSGTLTETTFKTALPGTIDLKRGDTVKIRVHPLTGRVFQLWKLPK